MFGVGFTSGWLFKLNQGPKGIFGTKMWWQEHRLVHGINFLVFAYLAIKKNKSAYIILLLDWLCALVFYLNKHY